MAYIGNTVQNQGFSPAVDYFNGDGTTVTFTLSRPVASVAQLTAVIDNVIQNPSSAFTVAGNAITFTSAPLSGTNNIWVEYTSLVTTYAAISQDPSVIGDITATGGFLSTGDFGNTYTDGTIVDYVTGNTRITTGPVDGMTFYNGGPTARNALMTLNSSGNMGVGTTTLNGAKLVVSTGGVDTPSTSGNMTSGVLVQVGSGSQALNYGNDVTGAWYNAAYANNAGVPLAHRWLTGGTERMRIDSSGRVTIPFQPGFRAYHTGNITWNSGALTPIIYNATIFNTGNYYNTSTGVFTAPIAGTYCFSVYDMYMDEPSYNFIYLAIQINGTTTSELMRQGTKSNYDTFGGAIITSLAANDQVRVVCGLNVVDAGYLRGGNEMNSFMGYLLG